MSLRVTRVWADSAGETHLSSLELPVGEPMEGTGIARFEIPTTTMLYVEYPAGELEISPGLHRAPRRQLVCCLQGSFEVTTSSGQSELFRRGDWLFADDTVGRGHTTGGVGEEQRINLVIGVADEWVPAT